MPRFTVRRVAAIVTAVAIVTCAAVSTPESAARASTSSKTYHVDCSRKSGGNGLSRPFNRIAAVSHHAAFAPGDRILFRRGTTCTGRLHPRGSGTAADRIVMGAYGRGSKPTIRGHGTPDLSGAIELVDVHHWTVQDLHVTNAGKGRSTRVHRSGVLLLNTRGTHLDGMVVQRLQIDHVVSNIVSDHIDSRPFGGIIVRSTGTSGGYRNLLIANSRIIGVSRTGIMVTNRTTRSRDAHVRITGNLVRRARGDSIVLRGVNDSRIDHNVSADGSNMFPCPRCNGISPSTANVAIWPTYSNHVRIDHNEVYGEHASGGDGEAFDVDRRALNTVVEYNYAHDNDGGGILFCGSKHSTARFNIFQNNRKSAFAFIGTIPASDTKIYNNTVYNSRTSEARISRYFNGTRGSKISFKNNLLYNYGNRDYLWPETQRTTAANTLIGLHGDGRPHDSKTSRKDPGLKRPGSGRTGFTSLGGYRPKRPAHVQRGTAISNHITRDFFGKKIDPRKPPRGAAG